MTTTTTEMKPEPVKETCAGCGEPKSLTKGMIRKHTIKKVPCPGGGLHSVEQGGTVEEQDVHCRACGVPAELTGNGRVKTHLINPLDPEEGNCPGGSDFPAEHYPDLGTNPDMTEEADPFGDSGDVHVPEHEHRFEYVDVPNGGPCGSFCTVEGCGLEEPLAPVTGTSPEDTGACSAADGYAPHSYSWNPHSKRSECVGCGEPDTAALKAERFEAGRETPAPEPRVGKPSEDVKRAAARSRTTAAPVRTSSQDDEAADFLNGSGPAESSSPGPWFEAAFDSTCDTCGGGIFEGDRIRADGTGGYECEEHEEDAPEEPAIGTKAHRETEAMVKADPAPASDDDEAAEFLLGGQGKADDDSERYGRWGRYKIRHPDTGKPELWQRATTAAKIISNTFTLNQWHQRMTAKGLTMRDDLLLRASALDVKKDRDALNKLCEEAQVTAGSKISADLGTALHAVTERIDRGQDVKVPAKFQPLVRLYTDTVRESGLTVVPGRLEQTTGLTQYEVAGTFDRIFRLPNGEYVIGDLKTGAELSYGEQEIEIQLAIYAHGVNTHGIWDWETKTWTDPGLKVRDDIAVVMHLPAESVVAGKPKCTLYWVNLKTGWGNLALAKQVEKARKPKNQLRAFTVADVSPYSGNVDVRPVESTTPEPDRAPVTTPRVPGNGGGSRPKGPCPDCTLEISLKLDGTPYEHTCVRPGASEEEKFLTGAAKGPVESGSEKMARVRALFDACTTKKEAGRVFKEIKGQLPPAAEKAVVDETLARLKAAQDLALEPVCQECDTDNHRCPGCGESVPHGTVACQECSFRIRFEEVKTKADAQALWREAKEILPKVKLDPMVADTLSRLKKAQEARTAPPPEPREPTWSERFDGAKTRAEATALWKEARSALPKAELDQLVKATLARLG